MLVVRQGEIVVKAIYVRKSDHQGRNQRTVFGLAKLALKRHRGHGPEIHCRSARICSIIEGRCRRLLPVVPAPRPFELDDGADKAVLVYLDHLGRGARCGIAGKASDRRRAKVR